MQRHKISLYASGIAGMEDICSLLSIGIDPKYPPSKFVPYTEILGEDFNGQPIEAGLPTATWVFPDPMPQSDFEYLHDFANQHVYIHTAKETGARGLDFATYSCYANRPTGDFDEENPLVRHNVTISFTALVVQ